MIKKFLGTTALVGAMLVSAGTVEAQQAVAAGGVRPAATFSGSNSFNAYSAPQKVRNSSGNHFGSTGRFNVNVNGSTANGIGYGYTATFTTDTNATNTVEENYITLTAAQLGTLILGDSDGVEDLMIYDGSEIMGGTGGFNGNWSQVFNISTNALTDDEMVGDTADATKITYMSPVVYGLQLGVSYTPNTLQNGFAKVAQLYSNAYTIYSKNNIAAALNYNNVFNGFSVTLSGVYMHGKAAITPAANNAPGTPLGARQQLLLPANAGNPLISTNGDKANMKDLSSWMVGGVLGYGGFQLGGGYFDNGKSFVARDAVSGKAGNGWNVALGYTYGPASVGVGYFSTSNRSSVDHRSKAKVTSVTGNYNLAQGFDAYVEGNWIETNSSNTSTLQNKGDGSQQIVGKNTGQVYILGTKISF